MESISYLLDENMPHGVRDQLLYHEPELKVLCIGDEFAPYFGTPDPIILEWIEENGYILVSRNRKTILRHLKDHLLRGRHVPGILLLRCRLPMGQLIEDLRLIFKASQLIDYRDHIEFYHYNCF